MEYESAWTRLERWLTSSWAPGVVLAASGLGLLVLVVAVGGRETTEGRELPTIWVPVLLASMLVFAVGGTALMAHRDKRRFLAGDRRARIAQLTKSLKEAVTLISLLEAEVRYGERTLAELQERSVYQQQAASLSAEQAAAVRAVLRDELEVQGRSSFRRDVIIATVSLIVGGLISRFIAGG